MARLGPNRYGKAEVRVVRVARGAHPGGGDVIRDWNVSTSLSGDLDAASLAGDNSHVLPTDSQKNKVYALARELGPVAPEAFGLQLASFFVTSQEPITRARVSVEEYGWSPIGATGYSFARSGDLVRTTTVVLDAERGAFVVSGVRDLVVMNTTASEFWGFPKDGYTTLPETKDRILATAVSARWRYRPAAITGPGSAGEAGGAANWDTAFTTAKAALLAAFAGTYSYSLQQTLYAMGTRVLADLPAACEVRLALPNKHHYLVDLAPFGLENPSEVYNAGDRPYGLIEGHVLADDAPDEGLAWA
jgi:urate oxidase